MHQRLKTVNEFAVTLLMQSDLDAIAWTIADRLGSILGFDDCVIYLRYGQVLVQAAAYGEKKFGDRDIRARIEIPLGQGIVGTVAETGVAEIVADTRRDPRYIWDQFAGRSELAVPIIYQGQVLGIIDSEAKAANAFDRDDLEFLQSLANMAAPRIASELGRLQLGDAERRLRHSEDVLRYRLEFENLISAMSSRFINLRAAEVDGGIEAALQQIGEFVNADAAYVSRFYDDHSRYSQTHLWRTANSRTRKENLQDMRVAELPWWMDQLKNGVTVAVDNVDELPDAAGPERRLLQSVDIKSVVEVPMSHQGIVTGYLGLSCTRDYRNWSADDKALLELVGQIFSNALQHKETEEELVKSRSAAQAASRAKSQFLANMSHELRTPLNAIIGYSELLQLNADVAASEALSNDVGNINRAGNHLLGIIADILDLAKIEAGKTRMHNEPYSLSTLVASISAIAEPLMQENDNHFTVVCDADIGTMHGDETRVRQVILNLIGNAAKFTDSGQITFEVETLFGNGPPRVCFSVTDSGIGIPEDKLEHIFAEFEQVDSSNTREYGGTGLGLAISKRICRLMGGDIHVTSRPDIGSRFSVTLPLGQAESDAAEPWQAA